MGQARSLDVGSASSSSQFSQGPQASGPLGTPPRCLSQEGLFSSITHTVLSSLEPWGRAKEGMCALAGLPSALPRVSLEREVRGSEPRTDGAGKGPALKIPSVRPCLYCRPGSGSGDHHRAGVQIKSASPLPAASPSLPPPCQGRPGRSWPRLCALSLVSAGCKHPPPHDGRSHGGPLGRHIRVFFGGPGKLSYSSLSLT